MTTIKEIVENVAHDPECLLLVRLLEWSGHGRGDCIDTTYYRGELVESAQALLTLAASEKDVMDCDPGALRGALHRWRSVVEKVVALGQR